MSLHKGLSIGWQPPESFYKDLGVTCFVTRYENLALKFNPALVQLNKAGRLTVAGVELPYTVGSLRKIILDGLNGIVDGFAEVRQEVEHIMANMDRDPRKHEPVRRGRRAQWVEKVMFDMGMYRHQYKHN